MVDVTSDLRSRKDDVPSCSMLVWPRGSWCPYLCDEVRFTTPEAVVRSFFVFVVNGGPAFQHWRLVLCP